VGLRGEEEGIKRRTSSSEKKEKGFTRKDEKEKKPAIPNKIA